MSVMQRPAPTSVTHEVANQVPPLAPLNLFTDAPRAASRRSSARAAAGRASAPSRSGEAWGGAPLTEWGVQANENPPKLRTHDRYGHRIDEVEFHPAWHQLMALASEHGLHALPWTSDRDGRARRRAPRSASRTGAGRGRPRLPDHDDLRGGPRAAHDAGRSRPSGSRC